MQYHAVNIGRPYQNEWWQRLLTLGTISTGFGGKPGDKGEKVLKSIEQGDWVLAYANKYGFVGAGICNGPKSYKLLKKTQLPVGYESSHRHHIEVDWKCFVFDLSQGIQAGRFGLRAPRQTRQQIRDDSLAKRVIDALRDSATQTTFLTSGEWGLAVEFLEGAATQVLVNRYERDPFARRACLLHWGLSCHVCDFNFEQRYGKVGAGFIHVHHLTPISSYKESHKVNPIADMRPVCANCHAMLHQSNPPILPDELKRKLRSGA